MKKLSLKNRPRSWQVAEPGVQFVEPNSRAHTIKNSAVCFYQANLLSLWWPLLSPATRICCGHSPSYPFFRFPHPVFYSHTRNPNMGGVHPARLLSASFSIPECPPPPHLALFTQLSQPGKSHHLKVFSLPQLHPSFLPSVFSQHPLPHTLNLTYWGRIPHGASSLPIHSDRSE